MSDIQTRKKVLRKRLLTERRRLSNGEYAFKSRRITSRILEIPELQSAHYIHVFWPIVRNREIDTRYLIKELTLMGKKCVLPRVLSYSNTPTNSKRMEHCLYSGETNLKPNRWDVYEPVSSETVPVASFDLVVVPALAVDSAGIRLGYGKGYYDEFLTEINALTICPVFNSFFVNELPTESHDVPVDILVTEQDVVRLERNAT